MQVRRSGSRFFKNSGGCVGFKFTNAFYYNYNYSHSYYLLVIIIIIYITYMIIIIIIYIFYYVYHIFYYLYGCPYYSQIISCHTHTHTPSPPGTCREQQQKNETQILQVKINIKGATGIPVPDDDRARDVLRRSLRCCLFLENPSKKRNSAFIGKSVLVARVLYVYTSTAGLSFGSVKFCSFNLLGKNPPIYTVLFGKLYIRS